MLARNCEFTGESPAQEMVTDAAVLEGTVCANGVTLTATPGSLLAATNTPLLYGAA